MEKLCTDWTSFVFLRHCSTNDLHWLPVAARIKFKLCTLVYQSVTGNAPTYINDMLQPVSGLDRQTILRSASKGDLVVPPTRLKFGERAFRVADPRLWNELPSDIRKASTLAISRHSYSANTMALSWNSNNTAMFFVVLLLFLILICVTTYTVLFYHLVLFYCMFVRDWSALL